MKGYSVPLVFSSVQFLQVVPCFYVAVEVLQYEEFIVAAKQAVINMVKVAGQSSIGSVNQLVNDSLQFHIVVVFVPGLVALILLQFLYFLASETEYLNIVHSNLF